MVHPNDIVLGGWDISGLNMAEAMERGRVLDFELQKQLVPYMKDVTPLPGGAAAEGAGGSVVAARCMRLCPRSCRCMCARAVLLLVQASQGSAASCIPRLSLARVMCPGRAQHHLLLSLSSMPCHTFPRPPSRTITGIYDPAFIAANQEARADNVLKGSKAQQVEAVRAHIREFKAAHGLDKVVVLWTANTERYAQVRSSARALEREMAGCMLPHVGAHTHVCTRACNTPTHSNAQVSSARQ